MSAFGWTARENGSRGTDHGHANVMLALGGAVRAVAYTGTGQGARPNSSMKPAMLR
jgi:uncharacterized protein (DUF1501 family)